MDSPTHWVCSACGAWIPLTFDHCLKCNSPRTPAAPRPQLVLKPSTSDGTQATSFRATIVGWPHLCACCCALPDTQVLAKRTYGLGSRTTVTVSVPVPYCKRCSRHVVWWTGAIILAVVASIFSISVTFDLVRRGVHASPAVQNSLIVVITGIIAFTIFALLRQLAGVLIMSKACAAWGKAVRIRYDGRYEFANRVFERSYWEQ
jgi:hypothetical protein